MLSFSLYGRNNGYFTACLRGQSAWLGLCLFTVCSSIVRDVFAELRAMMDQGGVMSLCLSSKKLRDRRNGRIGGPNYPERATSDIANYAYNVGMKLNIRMGNINHSIESSNFNAVPPGTLILGADVIHPGISSVKGTPSIAALVGSVDNRYAKYLGSMRIQCYIPGSMSKEIIDDDNMRSMARERLEAWRARNNGTHPSNILYYRDGVGDSQYDQVISNEVAMIRAAYKDAVAGTDQASTTPKITAVVGVKRHTIRLYPHLDGPKPKVSSTDNCLPGIVVDSGITHPYHFDFFLISHEGLKGTARPTHYIVLLNEIWGDRNAESDARTVFYLPEEYN